MFIIETLLSIILIIIAAMTFSSISTQLSKTISTLKIHEKSISQALNHIEASKAGIIDPSIVITPISSTLNQYKVTITKTNSFDYIQ